MHLDVGDLTPPYAKLNVDVRTLPRCWSFWFFPELPGESEARTEASIACRNKHQS